MLVTFFGPVNEQTSARYTAMLTDETGAAVDGTALDTATVTLLDALTGTVINGRDVQNIKNANGVTISALGAIVWAMAPADNAMVGTQIIEEHVALFVFTWGGGGVKACRHQVHIKVQKLARIA